MEFPCCLQVRNDATLAYEERRPLTLMTLRGFLKPLGQTADAQKPVKKVLILLRLSRSTLFSLPPFLEPDSPRGRF